MINIKHYLNSLKGLSVQNCLRLYSENDFEDIPVSLKDEESDGSTFLIFSNNLVYGFYANTEIYSIDIKKIKENDIPIEAKDVSGNSFWKNIIGIKILCVEILKNEYSEFYGFRFSFENNIKIDIQYIAESNYTFDAIVIRKPEPS